MLPDNPEPELWERIGDLRAALSGSQSFQRQWRIRLEVEHGARDPHWYTELLASKRSESAKRAAATRGRRKNLYATMAEIDERDRKLAEQREYLALVASRRRRK